MGWKTLKETFGIGHMVQVVADKGICIGSGYVHDLAVVDPKTGEVRCNATFGDFLSKSYPALLAADPKDIVAAIEAPDTFERSVVYTYDGGNIVEKLCEEPGWPNVTHDGCMMYENTYSTDKATVVAWARRAADLAVSQTREHIERLEGQIAEARGLLVGYEGDRAKLERDHPRGGAAEAER